MTSARSFFLIVIASFAERKQMLSYFDDDVGNKSTVKYYGSQKEVSLCISRFLFLRSFRKQILALADLNTSVLKGAHK